MEEKERKQLERASSVPGCLGRHSASPALLQSNLSQGSVAWFKCAALASEFPSNNELRRKGKE